MINGSIIRANFPLPSEPVESVVNDTTCVAVVVAVCCSTLPCVAVCCRVLQCVQCVAVCDYMWCAVTRDTLSPPSKPFQRIFDDSDCAIVCCSVLQCVAVYCSVLQCVALYCHVLQCVAVCGSVL